MLYCEKIQGFEFWNCLKRGIIERAKSNPVHRIISHELSDQEKEYETKLNLSFCTISRL